MQYQTSNESNRNSSFLLQNSDFKKQISFKDDEGLTAKSVIVA